ncbi:MAG: ATPase F0F1 [Gammaproteobacteria bacterium]|nr:ATPase F0F1 [Gammaproteobacteria bacterium]
MNKQSQQDSLQQMQRQAKSMARMRKRSNYSPLMGLGAFGVIGWSVTLPSVAGAFVGMWLERVAPQRFSWPLALLLAGLVFGLLMAFVWLQQQQKQTLEQNENAGGQVND